MFDGCPVIYVSPFKRKQHTRHTEHQQERSVEDVCSDHTCKAKVGSCTSGEVCFSHTRWNSKHRSDNQRPNRSVPTFANVAELLRHHSVKRHCEERSRSDKQERW